MRDPMDDAAAESGGPGGAGSPLADGPLGGLVVLDLSRVMTGPFCTMLLADMGARVIKVEQRDGGDDTRAWGPPFDRGESLYFRSVNRNKESLTLDLKHPGGRGVLDRLLARADVLVENFRPGTLERQGLGYEQLAPSYPRLVYCSISGFGRQGPRRDQPGYDVVIQAEGGLMSVTGAEDGAPYRMGLPISDIVAGLYAAHGVTLALLARERTGSGQLVDVALLDAAVSLLTYHATRYFATREPSRRMGNGHPSIAPYDTFATSDGVMVLAVGNDAQWARFCTAAGLESLASDPRFATNPDRVAHRDALTAILQAHLRTRTRSTWIALVGGAGVPCGSVRDVGETLDDPQLAARDMIVELDQGIDDVVRLIGLPVKLSANPGRVRTPPPRLGEHTNDVLGEIGFSMLEIERLRNDRVI